MNTPLVSVIIPNYCHSLYLDERIQSVLKQTYNNIEVIILDDCSPDNGASKAVIEKYHHDERITHIIYNEKNSGSTFRQWNKGFRLAKGELIWIAESDDVADIHLLETLVSQLVENGNIVLGFCNLYLIDGKSKRLEKPDYGIWSTTFTMNGQKFISRFMLGSCSIWNASGVVFNRTAINAIPQDYMEYKASGDRLFWIYIIMQGDVFYTSKKLNFFRQHNQKVSPKAETSGLQRVEDYKTYRNISHRIRIGWLNHLFINGYHYERIFHHTKFEGDGKENALSAWRQSLYFNKLSYIALCIAKRMGVSF